MTQELSKAFKALRQIMELQPIVNCFVVSPSVYNFISTEVQEGSPGLGAILLDCPIIETDEAFAFQTVEDGRSFIKELQNLKDLGMTWADIVKAFVNMKRWSEHSFKEG